MYRKNVLVVSSDNVDAEDNQINSNTNYLIQSSSTISIDKTDCKAMKENRVLRSIEAIFADKDILDTKNLLLSRNICVSERSFYISLDLSHQNKDATGRSRNFSYFFMSFWSIFAKIKSENTLFCKSKFC